MRRSFRRLAVSAILAAFAAACGTAARRPQDPPQDPAMPRERPESDSARGLASWYGRRFQGRRTASGERYNMNALTAAHRTLPFGSRVRVRCPATGRSVVVRINDRGPYSGNRLIDLSYAAGRKLGILASGTAPVELEVLSARR